MPVRPEYVHPPYGLAPDPTDIGDRVMNPAGELSHLLAARYRPDTL